MKKPIPTSIHGVLDYLSVPTLLVLPRALQWSESITNLMSGVALATLGTSLMTHYELGLLKLLPMPLHLSLDAINGTALAAAPFLLGKGRNNVVTGVLLGLGAFEIGAALLTQTQPSLAERRRESQKREMEIIGV